MKSHNGFFSMAPSRKTASRHSTYNSVREALSDCPETSNLPQAFTTDQITHALKATKAGKALGPDVIFLDMLKDFGPAAVRWLQAFYHVLTTANIQNIWRSANVISIRKRAGLMMKLSKATKCRTTIRLIASLVSKRNLRVSLGTRSCAVVLQPNVHQ